MDITVGLAFVAGIASFLSPCVLSLVPAYVGYLGGLAAGDGEAENRATTFLHGIFFVLGFSIVFVTFNILGYGLGRIFYDFQIWLSRLGGLIVIIFGLHMTGIFRIPFLEYDTRIQKMPERKWGYLSSALMGVVFSAGWSPCVGPTLGAIITLAITRQSLAQAVGLGVAYSAGLGIPFLLAALGIGWVTVILRRYSGVMRWTEIVMGVILIIVGLMLMSGAFNLLATLFPAWAPSL
ncbi:MAG: cytochrome c biogenesis protein CcdA [Anaerolineales bacterium]